VVPDGAVLDAVWNRKVAGKFAGLEYSLEVGCRKPAAITVFGGGLPYPRSQCEFPPLITSGSPVAAAIKIYRCGLTGVAGEDADGGPSGGSESRT
jgi:hypothetical protein